MNFGNASPTGKHAHCRKCYDLAQEAWITALDHGVTEWTVIDGDHSGRFSNPARIVDSRDVRTQYKDRVSQALATDARAAGTTILDLGFSHTLDVANEIATLYPAITPQDIAVTLYHIREEATA